MIVATSFVIFVAITLPASTSDASFEAFRKQLAGIAQKKDRAALAGLVAASFFWFPDDTDTADKAKSGIDNLATAIGLAGRNPVGWEVIADFAAETSNMPDPKRQGVICAPVQPTFDDKEAEELAKATQTNPSEWVFPVRDGVEVRSGAQPKAAVIEKLGLHLVRTLEDSSPAAATSVKVITPSGKTGYVPPDAIRDIGGAQMCYVKEGSGWKIAGFLGRL